MCSPIRGGPLASPWLVLFGPHWGLVAGLLIAGALLIFRGARACSPRLARSLRCVPIGATFAEYGLPVLLRRGSCARDLKGAVTVVLAVGCVLPTPRSFCLLSPSRASGTPCALYYDLVIRGLRGMFKLALSHAARAEELGEALPPRIWQMSAAKALPRETWPRVLLLRDCACRLAVHASPATADSPLASPSSPASAARCIAAARIVQRAGLFDTARCTIRAAAMTRAKRAKKAMREASRTAGEAWTRRMASRRRNLARAERMSSVSFSRARALRAALIAIRGGRGCPRPARAASRRTVPARERRRGAT